MNSFDLEYHEVLSFEDYGKCRRQVRETMIPQRKIRSVALTENIRLSFENKSTVQYQIQEVLHAARCSTESEIKAQIETYKHLLPNGRNLIATLLLEFEDELEAQENLEQLKGIEQTLYLQVEGHPRIWPFCNDDVEGQFIICPVHYLRFELTEAQCRDLSDGASLRVGIAHFSLPIEGVLINGDSLEALKSDLTV